MQITLPQKFFKGHVGGLPGVFGGNRNLKTGFLAQQSLYWSFLIIMERDKFLFCKTIFNAKGDRNTTVRFKLRKKWRKRKPVGESSIYRNYPGNEAR